MYFGSAQIIGLLLIWGFTLLNLRGVKYALSIQNFLSILKISGIILFIILGFSIGNLDFSRFQFQQSNLPFSYGDFEFNFNIASAVVPVSFAYLGWNMVTYVAEEINEPSKNIPRSVTIACLSVIVLYSLINIL